MEYVIGIVLALVVSCFARLTGFDRDRVFYPTMAVVIASYYVLFAVLGGSSHALAVDLVAMAAFVVVAVIGFKSSLWWVVASLAAHGVFDALHGFVVTNPGVPDWYPGVLPRVRRRRGRCSGLALAALEARGTKHALTNRYNPTDALHVSFLRRSPRYRRRAWRRCRARASADARRGRRHAGEARERRRRGRGAAPGERAAAAHHVHRARDQRLSLARWPRVPAARHRDAARAARRRGPRVGARRVDLDGVARSRERSVFDPLRYLAGSVEVVAAGRLEASDGKGLIRYESATVGGVSVPRPWRKSYCVSIRARRSGRVVSRSTSRSTCPRDCAP